MKYNIIKTRYIAVLIMSLLFPHPIMAEEMVADTVVTADTLANAHSADDNVRTILRNELSYSPLPIIGAGFLATGCKERFRTARNNMEPTFTNSLDNYLQYVPLVASFALKTAGVEGRSSWSRYLASSAMSYAIMAALTNGMKYTMRVQRPDGTSRNSFPSGHTATAFAAATILHKEYGLTRSPWYSAFGYATAMTTGVMRSLNNRHWISDIMVGAGVGIFSVDLGYFLCDLMFREKGIVRMQREDIGNFYSTPSFFNISMGFGFYNNINAGNTTFRTNAAIHTSAELAWFPNPYIGIGGRLRVATMPVSVNGLTVLNEQGNRVNNPSDDINDQMSVYKGMFGIYGSYPMARRFAIGGKALVGRQVRSRFGYEGVAFDNDDKYDRVEFGSSSSFAWGVGVNFAYAYRNSIAWRLDLDYDQSRTPFSVAYTNLDGNTRTSNFTQTLRCFSVGGSMSVMF